MKDSIKNYLPTWLITVLYCSDVVAMNIRSQHLGDNHGDNLFDFHDRVVYWSGSVIWSVLRLVHVFVVLNEVETVNGYDEGTSSVCTQAS